MVHILQQLFIRGPISGMLALSLAAPVHPCEAINRNCTTSNQQLAGISWLNINGNASL
jgi:hypothetical protein